MRHTAILIFTITVCCIAASGCSKKAPIEVAQSTTKPIEATNINTSMIQSRIREANDMMRQREFENAALIYESLARRFASESGAFEVGLLTNAALAHLQSGERDRFLRNASTIATKGANLVVLPRNTQLVLAIASSMQGTAENQDSRIGRRLRHAVASALSTQKED